MTKTKQALVLSAFEDVTSGDRFAAGDTPMLSKGAFDNFEAAGLVREADPVPDPAAAPAKPAPRKRTRAAK